MALKWTQLNKLDKEILALINLYTEIAKFSVGVSYDFTS